MMPSSYIQLQEHVDAPSMAQWPKVIIAKDQIAMIQEGEFTQPYGNQKVYRTVIQLKTGTHVVVRQTVEEVIKQLECE